MQFHKLLYFFPFSVALESVNTWANERRSVKSKLCICTNRINFEFKYIHLQSIVYGGIILRSENKYLNHFFAKGNTIFFQRQIHFPSLFIRSTVFYFICISKKTKINKQILLFYVGRGGFFKMQYRFENRKFFFWQNFCLANCFDCCFFLLRFFVVVEESAPNK